MLPERLRRVLWIGAAVLCPAIPLHFYFAGSWYSILHPYSLGMVFGILSYVWFAEAIVLSARIRSFDRLFGHDRVMVFHGRLAGAALVCAGAHVLFKFGTAALGSTQVSLGVGALAIFGAVTVVTVFFMVGNVLHRFRPVAATRALFVGRLGFDYSRLKRFHYLPALALALVTVHVLMASPTAETRARLALMGAVGGAGLLAYVLHKAVRVAVCHRRALRITAVREPASGIVELRAARADGRALRHRAGQFGYVRILSRACGAEEHPFTISSAPGADGIAITVKALGDYTARLASVAVGTTLWFDGPYGRFTPVRDAGPTLFVAGGIGITPFLSILREWDAAGMNAPVTLIWSVRTKGEWIDGGWFEGAALRHKAFTYVPVVTREGRGSDRPARVDRALLRAHVDSAGAARTAAYVCGPEPLRRAVVENLRALGVPRRAIHYESFGS